MTELNIWPPAPQPVPALSLVGTSGDAHWSAHRATLLLARCATTEFAGAGPHSVRELWLPAAAGGVVLAFGAVVAVSMGMTLALTPLPWPLLIPASLLAGVLAASAQRTILSHAREHQHRWLTETTVLTAASLGAPLALVPAGSAWLSDGRVPTLVAAVGRAGFGFPPLVNQWLSAAPLSALSPTAHTLVAANGLALAPVLLMLALLPVPTMTGRRRLEVPRSASTALAHPAVRPELQGGPLRRAFVWVGGMRDDFAARWPTLDRLYAARAGLVAATALLGALAGGTAADAAAPGLPWVDAAAGLAWGWTCAALARHQFVVGDDALHDDPDHLRPLGAVAAILAGLYTGLLFVIGLLDRVMAPTAVTDSGTPLQLLGAHAADPMTATAAVIVIVFAVFVHVLPVLPWGGGEQLSVMQRLVTLIDMAAAFEAAGNGSPHEQAGTQRNAP